jgi:hypothetical protein
MTVKPKRKTQGVDPKLPIAAIATIVLYVLARYGVDLDPTLSLIIATLVGGGVGAAGPAPKVKHTA